MIRWQHTSFFDELSPLLDEELSQSANPYIKKSGTGISHTKLAGERHHLTKPGRKINSPGSSILLRG